MSLIPISWSYNAADEKLPRAEAICPHPLRDKTARHKSQAIDIHDAEDMDYTRQPLPLCLYDIQYGTSGRDTHSYNRRLLLLDVVNAYNIIANRDNTVSSYRRFQQDNSLRFPSYLRWFIRHFIVQQSNVVNLVAVSLVEWQAITRAWPRLTCTAHHEA